MVGNTVPPVRTIVRRGLLPAVAVAVLVLTTACAATPAPAVAPPQPAPPVADELSRTDVDSWLDGLVPAALERSGIAGASVSVVRDGEILTARGYGASDTGVGSGTPRAVDAEDTLFRVGSVSKVFTATAVMQLVESGDLDLDTDIDEYIDFALPTPLGAITLRNLLTHTAGFEEKVAGLIGTPGTALPELRDVVAIDPPEQIFAPGTVPAYSNYSNTLAGYIVERASGMPFAEYVNENVLERSGMTSSSFSQPLPERLAARLSNGYPDDSAPAVPFEMIPAAPAGALSSTAPDMARFMLAQLGELPAEQSLLDADTLELMHEPALSEDTLGTFAEGPRMAISFFDENRNGRTIIGHDGDTPVFHSAMRLYPDDRTGIFIVMNSGGRAPLDSFDLRSAVMDGFDDRYFPPTGAESSGGDISGDHAALAAGAYEAARAGHSTFVSVLRLNGQTQVVAGPDGTIVVTPGPETFRPTAYEEIAPWVWREVGGQETITMRESGGRVTAIGYGGAFTLLRADAAHDAALVVPIAVGSLAVLLISVIAWPAGAVISRFLSVPARRDPRGRAARVLTRVGVGAALVASLAWAVAIIGAFSYQDVPEAVARGIQIVQFIGVLAIAPATVQLIDAVRGKARWTSITGRALVLLGLIGVGWFAFVFKLIAPSVSY